MCANGELIPNRMTSSGCKITFQERRVSIKYLLNPQYYFKIFTFPLSIKMPFYVIYFKM